MSDNAGLPVWLDLGTTDLPAAKTFYEGVFGWTFDDSGADFNHYNMIRNGDALVGGAMDLTHVPAPEGGHASAWGVFLGTDDIDEDTQAAEEAGATVLLPPMEAGDAGRFSVLLDPAGAQVSLWQAGDTEGYAFTGTHGSPSWFELMTQDYDAALAFYTEAFGLKAVPMPHEEGQPEIRYVTHAGPEGPAYGICDARGFIPAERGSYWRVYFLVDDTDAAIARITELGGRLLDGPEDTEFGRIATVSDPTGAMFQIGDNPEAAAS